MIYSRFFYPFLLLFFISLPITAQERDTPRNGEGVHSFLKRNKRTPTTAYFDKFIELNKGKLGKNNALILGTRYTLPPLQEGVGRGTEDGGRSGEPERQAIGSKRREPLFGKKYEEYTIKSKVLAGACYFLSSGHGGIDCGATATVNGRKLPEDEYAYDVTLRLARNLLEHGATVHIIIQDKNNGIRDDRYLPHDETERCMGKKIPGGQKARLAQRTEAINQLSKGAKEKYQRAVFIHLDSRSERKQVDVYFYYQNGNQVSRRFVQRVRDTFEEQYKKHQPGRGFSGTISSRDLYVLNNTRPPALFAELANMQNKNLDQKRYLESSNRQAMANWMLRGFIKDYEAVRGEKNHN